MLKSASGGALVRKSSSGDLNLLVASPAVNVAMRQRCNQGFQSGNEDIEGAETPCSPMAVALGDRNWGDALQNIAWIASAVFIVYFGDRNENLISLLWHDVRVRRIALYIGFLGVVLNIGLVLYTTLILKFSLKSYDKHEIVPPTAPLMVLLGCISFCTFSYALWPIWSFLTIPLLITLFMALMVVSPYMLMRPLNSSSALRAD